MQQHAHCTVVSDSSCLALAQHVVLMVSHASLALSDLLSLSVVTLSNNAERGKRTVNYRGLLYLHSITIHDSFSDGSTKYGLIDFKGVKIIQAALLGESSV